MSKLDDMSARNESSHRSNDKTGTEAYNSTAKNASVKAFKEIYATGAKEAKAYNDYVIKSTDMMLKTVSGMYLTTYRNIYNEMSRMHNGYVSQAKSAVSRRRSGGKSTGTNGGEGWQDLSHWDIKDTIDKYFEDTGMSPKVKAIDKQINNIIRDIEKTAKEKGWKEDTIIKKIEESDIKRLKEQKKSQSNQEKMAKDTSTFIVNLATSYLDIWIRRAEEAVKRISSTYESTYSEVSAVLDMNYDQYSSWQTETRNTLTSKGLKNNIGITEVMQMLKQEASTGLYGSSATEKALSDVISKKISPYLDTTTDAYTDLYFALGGDQFATTMSGIYSSVSQATGNSRIVVKTLNSMTTELESVGMFARKELYAEDMADTEAMLAQMVEDGKITSAQATQLLDSAIKMTTDPYGTLTRGTTAEIVSLAKNMQDSTKSISSAADNEETLILTLTEYLGNADYSSDSSTLGNSALATYLYNGNLAFNKLIGTTADYLEDTMDKVSAESSGLSDYASLVNDTTTTRLQALTYATENTMLSTGQFAQKYPDLYNIVEQGFNGLITLGKNLLIATIANTAVGLVGSGKIKGLLSGAKGLLGKVGGTKLASVLSSTVSNAGSSVADGLSSVFGASASAGTLASGIAGGAGAGIGLASMISAINYRKNNINSTTNSLTKGLNTTAIASGGLATLAGGAAIFGAANAWNPIGWAALALAGVSVTANVLSRTLDDTTQASKDVITAYKNQVTAVKEDVATQKSALETLEDSYNNLTTLSDKKEFLVKNGIITVKEAASGTSLYTEKALNDYVNKQEDLLDKYENSFNNTSTIASNPLYGAAVGILSSGNKTYPGINSLTGKATNIAGSLTDIGAKNAQDIMLENEETVANYLSGMSAEDQRSYLTALGIDESKLKGTKKYSLAKLKRLIKYSAGGAFSDESIKSSDWLSKLGLIAKTHTDEEWQEDAKIYNLLATYQAEYEAGKLTTDADIASLENLRDTVAEISAKYTYKEHPELWTGFDIGGVTYNSPSAYGRVGITYVPRDNYAAMLHQGERVLTKAESTEYSKLTSGILSSVSEQSKNSASSSDVVSAIQEAVIEIVKAIYGSNKSSSSNRVTYAVQQTAKTSVSDSSVVSMTPWMSGVRT